MLSTRLVSTVLGLLLVSGCSSVDDADSSSPSRSKSDAPSSTADDASDDDTTDVAPQNDTPAGYTLSGGALFQGVKLPLFGEGADDSASIPVVIGRPGVIRLYKEVTDADVSQEMHAVLRYRDEAGDVQTVAATKTITQDSDDTDEDTVLDLDLPADAFHEHLEYQIEVRDGDNRLVGAFPEDADTFAALPADPHTKIVHVVVLPVKYGDTGRLPDTGAAQLERLAEQMRAFYPVAAVDVTVRSTPLVWSGDISADGTGWDDLLYRVLQERQNDGVADDVYYYGAFNPASSMQSYCQQGCVAGLSLLSDSVHDASARGSIGLGFTGDSAAETFVHEIGHAHGREHSPCGGAASPDPHYPYSQASIGVPGWDVRDGSFVQVGSGRRGTTDFMGYCENTWVSDYTWKKLFERITTLTEEVHPIASITPVAYRALRLDGGAPRWLGELTVRGQASTKTTTALLGNGTTRELPLLAFDHLKGEIVYVPKALGGQTITVAGQRVTVP